MGAGRRIGAETEVGAAGAMWRARIRDFRQKWKGEVAIYSRGSRDRRVLGGFGTLRSRSNGPVEGVV